MALKRDIKKARAGLRPAKPVMVTLRIPQAAWLTLEETLYTDSESSAFDANLRKEIRGALTEVAEIHDLDEVLTRARAALNGDSNDAEHDALYELVDLFYTEE